MKHFGFYAFICFFICFIQIKSESLNQLRLPNCYQGVVQRNAFSMYGDSRTEQFHGATFPSYAVDINEKLVKQTDEGGNRIFDLNAISTFGAYGISGTTAREWETLINNCNSTYPGGFIPDGNISHIHLGGNDILADYDTIADEERYWFILTILQNPLGAFKTLLEGFYSGNIRKTNELIWTWRLSASAMIASSRVKNISKHFASRGSRVLVSLPAIAWSQRKKNPEVKTMTRMLFAFSLFRGAIHTRLSSLSAYNLGLIRVDDMYRLSFDFTNYHASANSPLCDSISSCYLDFIHFSHGGNLKWGNRLARKLVALRWLPSGPNYLSDSNSEIEAIFDLEASDAGLSDSDIANGFFEIIKTEEIYRKSYINFTTYLRNPSVLAFSVRGSINAKFNEINGLSILGLPVANEIPFQIGGLQQLQLFECGFMIANLFGTNYYGTDKCDRIPSELHDEHPEFTTCTTEGVCSFRWFDYRVEKIVAERGRPPFFFNLVDENCLPDNIKLDSLGRLVMNPVGGPGAVSCEVEMTDADDRTIRKTIHLSSGL